MFRVKIQKSSVFFLPFFPENLETTLETSKRLCELRPELIVLPLPDFVKKYWIEAVKALPGISVISLTYPNGNIEYLIVPPICPLVEATRVARDLKVDIHFADLPQEVKDPPVEPPAMLPPYLIKFYGYFEYFSNLIKGIPAQKPSKRAAFLGERLIDLSRDYKKIAVLLPPGLLKEVLDYLKHPEGILYLPEKVPSEVEIYSLSKKGIREILVEPGFFHQKFEESRGEGKYLSLDRISLWEEVFKEAIERFKEATNSNLSPRDLEVFGKFLKNYLLIKGKFVPDIMDFILCARGVGGDELAFWVWEVATNYELKSSSKVFPEINLSIEDLQLPFKRLRLFRQLKSTRHRFRFLKKFTTREERKEFAKKFSGKVICSFPPEDVVVETFGKKVMEKGLQVVSENLKKLEPFTSSLKDGLDIKETLRRWGLEQTPYVVEEPKTSAKAGSVVIIFEVDPNPVTGEEKYPWKFTWHGEHHQESDMAFYATNPGEDVVGPGIARAKYGGFMLTYPPMRVYDIWVDPYFDVARDKAERLLLAGIDYSLEKYIIYIAETPPSSLAKEFARVQGKKIVFLPIGSFSRTYLEKIRIFHVLEGHHVRSYAHKYINK